MLLNTALTLAAANPISHVIDHQIGDTWLISNVTVMLFTAFCLTLLFIIPAARKIATGQGRTLEDLRAQGAHANFVEAVCLYLRDQVFKPILAEETDRYIPVLWTFFWFILICNMLGLVPLIDLTGGLFGINNGHGIGGTATQSIWVTGALATSAFVWWTTIAILKDPIGYFKHLTGGLDFSLPMLPIIAIIVVVEIIGTFVKPIALALRLFANMSGGHILLAVLFSFVPALIAGIGTVGFAVGIIPLLGATAIYMLEVLVGFIQAFIFTFLTGLFLGQLVRHEHDDHGDENQGYSGGVHVDTDAPVAAVHAG